MTPSTIQKIGPRSTTCMRHRVWMAACDDCRSAHAATKQGEKATAA